MGALQVRRWTKHNHDRLYVSTRSGLKVGWFDLRTHRRQVQLPDMWVEFEMAVNEWRQAHPGAGTAAEQVEAAPAAEPERRGPRAGGGQRLDEDLAQRRPGHNAAAMAERLRPRRRSVRWLAWLVNWRTRDYSWRVGAAGEAAVGAKLDQLARSGWRVLHGVTFGSGGDVDHLMIGPAGVFAVNAKHHPGAVVTVGREVVFVRGKPTGYVRKAHREAERVQAALRMACGRAVHVGPLLVFHGHRSLSGWVRRRPLGVQVLPTWAATWWWRLPGRPNLSPTDVEQLYQLARQPATWARV